MITPRDVSAVLRASPHQTVPQLRIVRRSLSNQVKAESADDVLSLATSLLKLSGFAGRFLAYEIVHYHRAAMACVDERLAVALGEGMCDWAAVDTFSCYVAGPAWREQQISDAAVRRWAASKDFWWRRAAVVSTVPLNLAARGGSGDTTRTLDICERVIDDREDMVVKALSWALRSLAPRDAGAVRAFLKTHQARLAPRVIREVRNKLTTGLKNPVR